MRTESIDPWVQKQPACCVGVEVVPRSLGGVTLKTVAEALCPRGCHRVVEMGARRSVYDLRTGSASPSWQGFVR